MTGTMMRLCKTADMETNLNNIKIKPSNNPLIKLCMTCEQKNCKGTCDKYKQLKKESLKK